LTFRQSIGLYINWSSLRATYSDKILTLDKRTIKLILSIIPIETLAIYQDQFILIIVL